jgi:hypothetical protein
MTQEDILRMARQAGGIDLCIREQITWIDTASNEFLERFANIAAAAEREKVANWMRSLGYATGHGDTIEDLLDHLGTQIAERLAAERKRQEEQLHTCSAMCDKPLCAARRRGVEAERQRCAQIAREFDKTHPNTNYGKCIASFIEERK